MNQIRPEPQRGGERGRAEHDIQGDLQPGGADLDAAAGRPGGTHGPQTGHIPAAGISDQQDLVAACRQGGQVAANAHMAAVVGEKAGGRDAQDS